MGKPIEEGTLCFAVNQLVNTIVDLYSAEAEKNAILKGALKDLNGYKYLNWENGSELPEQVSDLLLGVRLAVGPEVRTNTSEILEPEVKPKDN